MVVAAEVRAARAEGPPRRRDALPVALGAEGQRLVEGQPPRDLENAFFENAFFENAFFENFAKFWRARSRLYQNEILQENMRSTAFFKLYKICILLHRCNLKILAKHRFEKSAIFVKILRLQRCKRMQIL